MVDVAQTLGSGLGIGEQIRTAPQRDLMNQLGLQQAQQSLTGQRAQQQRQASEFEFSRELRETQIINQAAKALRNIDPSQQAAALQSLSPRLQSLGVDPTPFQQAIGNPQVLDAIIASSEGLIANPDRLTEFQRQNLALQKRRLDQQQQISPAQEGRLEQGERRLELQESKEAREQEKFDIEQQDIKEKEERSKQDKRRQAAIVTFDIDRALEQADSAFTTGFTGSIASAVPGTPAFDLKSTLDTIKANVGFNKLQEMRENSPTGGALGQVSENENRLLQSVLGSLEQSQSSEQFRFNLERLKVIFDAVVNGTQAIPFTQEDFDALPSGSTYISPDTGTLHRKE